jgi:hypothetical protein
MLRRRSLFERVVEALRYPRAYPHPVEWVTVLQTDVSVVFLAGDFVYKLKKPVHIAFVHGRRSPRVRGAHAPSAREADDGPARSAADPRPPEGGAARRALQSLASPSGVRLPSVF